VTDRELDKNAARRLAIIRHAREASGNVALTCWYYGISRQVFNRWLRRYEAGGLAGLRDRSKRPLSCPHETPAEVVAKIIYLRQNCHFGPAKISMYLKRYHDIEISNSGVWRILKRVDLSRLPAYQRYQRHDRKWKRYEKPQPGHAVQVDVKFIAPLSASSKKKYYQFTAIDDCTRVRVLRIYDRLSQKTAIQFPDFLPGNLLWHEQILSVESHCPRSLTHLTPGCSAAAGRSPATGVPRSAQLLQCVKSRRHMGAGTHCPTGGHARKPAAARIAPRTAGAAQSPGSVSRMYQFAVRPASTRSSMPVIADAWSEARNRNACATSSGLTRRFIGTRANDPLR